MKNYRVKIILVISVCLLVFFTMFSFYMTNENINTTVEESIASQSLESAKRISANFDVDTYKKFLENPEKNKYYWEISEQLNKIRVDMGALFVYTLKIDNPHVSKSMIVGVPRHEQHHFEIGDVCTTPSQQVEQAYQGKSFTTGIIHDPRHGNYLSVGTPIFDEEKQVIGYLAIDISMSNINAVKESVQEGNLLIFLLNAFLILMVIVSYNILQKWYQIEVAKELESTEDTYQGEIRTLISSVSSLRHDYLNHIQVIHGLLLIGETEKAKQYVDSLSNEVQWIESLNPEIEHPGLAILLKAKKIAAQNHQIAMKAEVDNVSFSEMKSTDLIKILSNLIDNAMDATVELPENERQISISCCKVDHCYVLKVINSGHKVADPDAIFKQGFSTKEPKENKVRGQGLFIVKEVVNKYHGDVTIFSTEDGLTTAAVKIPIK